VDKVTATIIRVTVLAHPVCIYGNIKLVCGPLQALCAPTTIVSAAGP